MFDWTGSSSFFFWEKIRGVGVHGLCLMNLLTAEATVMSGTREAGCKPSQASLASKAHLTYATPLTQFSVYSYPQSTGKG